MKYRDVNSNEELRDSTSAKIVFTSNLFLEFIIVWRVKSRIKSLKKC